MIGKATIEYLIKKGTLLMVAGGQVLPFEPGDNKLPIAIAKKSGKPGDIIEIGLIKDKE